MAAVVAVLLVVAALSAVLAFRVIGPGEQPARSRTLPTETLPPAGSVPGPSVHGNLVTNWSFEQNLDGWRTIGAAEAAIQPPGRTSGSSAYLQARGPGASRVGLALPGVIRQAKKGSRWVATVWVRSTAPGVRVTVRLAGPGTEGSQATGVTLPGIRWRRVWVGHTVATAGTTLDLEVTTADLSTGEALLIDEVLVRSG